MTEKLEIEERIMQAIRDQLGGEIAEDRTLADLGCDSLDLIELVMEAESILDSSLDEDMFDAGMTVSAFIDRALRDAEGTIAND
jgi:acyl carrier protein